MKKKKESTEIVKLDLNKLKVIEKKNKIFTTSRNIAENFDKRHDNILQAIKNLECSPEFTALNFKVSEYKDSTGRKLLEYLITKDGFAILVFGFTGKQAMEFKEAYIKKFNEMESCIAERVSNEWQQARNSGTIYQKELNDIIKDFIEYATAQGSQSAKMYYNHFAKLSNKVVCIEDGKRDLAYTRQLIVQSLIIDIVKETILEGMKENMAYKEIYSLCKERSFDLTSKKYMRLK